MKQTVEVISNLFPACQNCQVARNAGEDEINRLLTPDVAYTPPPKKSDIVATITCSYDTGVPVPGSNIVYQADVHADGKFKIGTTGPIGRCPGLNTTPAT